MGTVADTGIFTSSYSVGWVGVESAYDEVAYAVGGLAGFASHIKSERASYFCTDLTEPGQEAFGIGGEDRGLTLQQMSGEAARQNMAELLDPANSKNPNSEWNVAQNVVGDQWNYAMTPQLAGLELAPETLDLRYCTVNLPAGEHFQCAVAEGYDAQWVLWGSPFAFSAAPDKGYALEVAANGTVVAPQSGTAYLLDAVTANQQVTVKASLAPSPQPTKEQLAKTGDTAGWTAGVALGVLMLAAAGLLLARRRLRSESKSGL